MLNKGLRSDEKIIQRGPFSDLMKVDRISQRGSTHVVGDTRDQALLKEGDLLLEQDREKEAKHCYARCLEYGSYLPEAGFSLAVCALREGDADRAYELLVNLINPDPVEWAYFLLALVCKGQIEQARRLQDFYPRLFHCELRRARLVLGHPPRECDRVLSGWHGRDRKTIHRVAIRSDRERLARFVDILECCQQPDLANVLRHIPLAVNETSESAVSVRFNGEVGWRVRFYAGIDAVKIKLRLGALRPNVPPLPEFRYFWQLIRGLVPRSHKGAFRRIRMVLSKPPF